MGNRASNRIEGFKDQAMLDRLLAANRGGGFRMLLGLAGMIAGLVYLGMTGPKILDRWSACSKAVEQGLSATDVCIEQEKADHARNHSSYKKPFDEEKARRDCRWALDEQGLTDEDTRAFCFAGKHGHSGWMAVKKAGIVGGLPLGCGLLLFFWGLWRRKSKPLFFRVLRDSPERVVWIYVQHIKKRDLPDSRVVILGLDTGQLFGFHLGRHDSHDAANAVAAQISALAPWAHVGYDEHTRIQFWSDPASMRK